MNLLVIRHAIAGDREKFAATGQPDHLRPLTDQGRARMRRGVRGLRRAVRGIDVLASSPAVRAVQTAEIVARAYGGLEIVQLPELSPERRPEELMGWLRGQDAGATVAVVGHEPHLGFLVGWLLSGLSDSFVELKKGSACLLTFEDPPANGNAVLAWHLAPKHLRRLGR
ncbi:MAG TPA: histidine phosphatase family protein [Longimicrobium sp.]|nr:histidine phosphatase family protein [Longimicrobium sp.]